MDVYDRATEAEERFRTEALKAQEGKLPAGKSAVFCQEPRCGIPIPEERRRAVPGVQYCIDCQLQREQRERRGR